MWEMKNVLNIISKGVTLRKHNELVWSKRGPRGWNLLLLRFRTRSFLDIKSSETDGRNKKKEERKEGRETGGRKMVKSSASSHMYLITSDKDSHS